MARALSTSAARVLVVERGQPVPQEADNWNPEAVWKHLRYRATERWLDGDGAEFLPYTHYGVGGNTKFWGSVLYRLRREDFQAVEHMDGESPAWPIDYDTLEPYYERAERLYHVHGQVDGDPTEPPRGPFPYAADSTLRGNGGDSRRAAASGPSSLAPAARADSTRRAGRLRAVQHVQLLPLQDPREERRRSVRHRARARERQHRACGPTRGRCASSPTRPGRRSRRSRSNATATTVRVGASLVVVSCGAVNSAALLLRSAERQTSRGPRQLVRPRWPALHGAPRDDDAGLQSDAKERHRLPEDRRHQRLLFPRAAHGIPARPHSVTRADARRHGADSGAADTGLGVRCLGLARSRLAGDVRGSAARREPRRHRVRRSDTPALSSEQPRGARHARQGDEAHAAPAGILESDDPLAQEQEHHAPVRNNRLRHRPARVSARPLVPGSRRREPVRRRRLVLPIVGSGQPRPDHRGAGAAGGRPSSRRTICRRGTR